MRKSLWLGTAGVIVLLIAIAWNYAINTDGGNSEPSPVAKAPVPPAAEAPEPSLPKVPEVTVVPPAEEAAPVPEAEPARAPTPPSFDVVRVNPRGDTVIAGRAEPGMAVTILDGGTEIGSVTADSRGEWVLLPSQPLPPGSRELSLSGRMPDGTVVESTQVVVLVVPEPEKDIAGRPSKETTESLALMVPKADEGEIAVLQAPPAPPQPEPVEPSAPPAPQAIAEPEPQAIAEPKPPAEPKPVPQVAETEPPEPEPVPQAVAEPEPAAEVEPVPQLAAEPGPAAEPEPVPQTVAEVEPAPQAAVKVPQPPEPAAAPEPAPRAVVEASPPQPATPEPAPQAVAEAPPPPPEPAAAPEHAPQAVAEAPSPPPPPEPAPQAVAEAPSPPPPPPPATPEPVPQVAAEAAPPPPPVAVKPAPQMAAKTEPPKPVPPAAAAMPPPAPKPIPPARELALQIVDYDELGRLVIIGRAEPNARLFVYLSNRLIGTTEVNAERIWRLRPQEPVAPGQYQLRVDDVADDGKVLARIEVPFVRSVITGPLLRNKYAIVQPGNSLWRIARRTYGSGLKFTLIYQANKDYIQDPDLIYPGQVFKLPSAG